MTYYFEPKYFVKFKFTNQQLSKYLQSASKDLRIANNSEITEVVFRFSYDALVKLGITLIAANGYKVRSTAGHHVKTIEKLSEILDDADIEIIGNQMRKIRNTEFYHGGMVITEKQAKEFNRFVQQVFAKAKKLIKT